MQLTGGVNVTIGEVQRHQPLRFCIELGDDEDDTFWTGDHDEAITIFTMMIRRRSKGIKR